MEVLQKLPQLDDHFQNTPSDSTVSAAVLTHDPQRLHALCELWRGTGRDLWLTLQGTSMMPEIRPGSRLRVHCDRAERKPGDIIAFQRGNLLVVHRLKHFDAQGNLICQGDANSFLDAPAAPNDVVGVLVEVQPPGVWVQAHQNLGFLLGLFPRVARRGRRLLRSFRRGSHE